MGKTWIFNDGNRSPRTRTTTGGVAYAFWTASSRFQRSCGARQTRRWGDVLGAVLGEGARDVPSLFRARRNGHSDAYIHGLEIKIKQLIERITRGSPYVFQQGSASPRTARKSQAWCVRTAEPADGVDPIFRAPQLSRFKSYGLLCVERGWIEGQ